jgi:hypothetical protein
MQQVIMFWADNYFTRAEYIGFVDDDTVFTSFVHAKELFDGRRRPRVIVRHASTTNGNWAESTHYSLRWPTVINGMNYFPVIVKRSHLRELREFILRAHPKFSCFDEFYIHLLQQSDQGAWPCQFCTMMNYLVCHHRDEYRWHFEESVEEWGQQLKYPAEVQPLIRAGKIAQGTPKENVVSPKMLEPFPRVVIHVGYVFPLGDRLRASRTRQGRPDVMTSILREGYCYSLPQWKRSKVDMEWCQEFDLQHQVYTRGEWMF